MGRRAARRRFATTRWSLVIAAGRGAGDGREAALAELCEAYWYPLYAYLRRRGQASEEAADLTQGLFAELLARDDLARLAPEGGRFRGWLLSALRHHVAHERERARAEKRVAAHRLRARYRELLEAEVADTLEDGADVLEELRAITAALSE